MSLGPVLIVGAEGLLGTEFGAALHAHSPTLCSRADLDVRDRDSVWKAFERVSPKLVINTAAFTTVDRAETERSAAFAVNVKGARHLSDACREWGATLLHFSTDQVFDGTKSTPYTELDAPHPLNYYAQTKLESESCVAEHKSSLICRVQWLYGKRTPRFLHLGERTEFGAISDQLGAPTWSRDIVRWSLALLQKKHTGLFHLSYDDHASWAEIFEFVKSEMGFSVKLNPMRTEQLKLPAARPLYAVLCNAKLRKALGVAAVGSWKESLGSFLATYK